MTLQNAQAAVDQHQALGLTTHRRPSQHTNHPGAQWFSSAGLGLFIHWGIASVHGNIDLSWAMMANTPYDAAAAGQNKLTPAEYWRLAERFRPEHYNPDQWLAAAAQAGFQYAVLTTMHHDGYTLWPSRHAEFGVQSHLNGRDLVKPFVDACRRHGLKVGLYYSPPDWLFDREYMSFNYRSHDQNRFAGRPHFNIHHKPVMLAAAPPEHLAQKRRLFHQRVEELLTRYGRIDLLWFDGGDQDNIIRDRARELQPHIVINSRSCDGDYDCTECALPNERPSGWFETCHCWQQSSIPAQGGGTVDVWGYLKSEQYKTTAWMLETLARLRSWSANLLVNIGPRPDGQLPDVVYQRLAQTADWMKLNHASIIGAGPGPWPEKSNRPITIADGVWYVHCIEQGSIYLRHSTKPKSITFLDTALPVAWNFADGQLTIDPIGNEQPQEIGHRVLAIRWQ